MGIRAEVAATYQKIVLDVRVDGSRLSNVYAVDVSMGISQINAQATILVTSRPGNVEEGAEIEIWAGYNGSTGQLFKGECSGVDWDYAPGVVRISARDLLARTRLEWGGADREYNAQDDAAVIRNLLEAMGIPSSVAHIESSSWTLGNVETVIAPAGRPFWPLIEEIDQLAGYRTYTQSDGTIRRYRVTGNVGNGAAWSYESGVNVISCRRRRSIEGIVNRAIVTGVTYEGLEIGGAGVAEARADNPFIPDPPRYITKSIQSNLVETDDKAIEIAARIVEDNNRRPEVFEVEIVGNPLLQPLSVIDLEHEQVEAGSARLVVDRVEHSIRAGAFLTRFTTLGGNIVGVPTGIPPIPAFDVKLFQEAEDTGAGVNSIVVAVADGSASTDPDGDETAMTFAWSFSVDAGTVSPTTASTPIVRCAIEGAATVLTVELVLTDADGETATLEREFTIAAGAMLVEELYTAEGTIIAATADGEQTWNEYTLPGGASSTCLAPFAPAGRQYWGASDGHIYATADYLKTAAIDLGAPAGAVACTALWAHETDTSRLWAGFTNGAVYQGEVSTSGTPSATWRLAGNVGASIKEIRESVGTLGSLRATAGASYYASEDGGASWSTLHTFDTAWRMSAGWDQNLASGLNDPAPIYNENGAAPTLPALTPAVEHIRGLSHGWREKTIYAADDQARLFTAADDTLAALVDHADTAPAQVNHMIRSGNVDGVVYMACGDGTGTNNGAVKWLPGTKAPWYIRKTTARQVHMIGYGAALLPAADVDFVMVPLGESGTKDKWHRYRDGVWSSGPLPQSGWKWAAIKVHPTNALRWLLLGFPSSVAVQSGVRATARTTQVLWISEDGGQTWTNIPIPQPIDVSTGLPLTTTNYKFNAIEWQPERGRWYLLGQQDDGGSATRGCWWYGTGADDPIGKRDSTWLELRYLAAGINGSMVAGEADAVGGGTSGGIGFIPDGSFMGAACYPHTGAGDRPAGPIDTRPGSAYELYQANVSTSPGLNQAPKFTTTAYNTTNSGSGSVGPDLAGAYVWVGCGATKLFVASDVVGKKGIFAVDYASDIVDSGGPIDTGSPAQAMTEAITLRVGRRRRIVCVAYGNVAGSFGFVAFDGAVWSSIAMPDATMNELAGAFDTPYDVIEPAAEL